jgi:hypothetical protein
LLAKALNNINHQVAKRAKSTNEKQPGSTPALVNNKKSALNARFLLIIFRQK